MKTKGEQEIRVERIWSTKGKASIKGAFQHLFGSNAGEEIKYKTASQAVTERRRLT